MVRVAVAVDTTAVSLAAASAFEIAGPGGDVVAHGTQGTAWSIVAAGDGAISGTAGDQRFGPIAGPVSVRAADRAATLTINGKPYRGSALLLSNTPGRVTAVNVVDMEQYLKGVVPFEIGKRPRSEIEASKSQAVAARTYAVRGMGKGPRGFDFYATVQDQVYGGVSGEDSVSSRAVEETAGEIITYDGQPILAYYSSTCGGHTAAIEESWPWRAPLPYLKSVSDMIPGTNRAYCDISSRYRWSAAWTMDQLRAVLRTGLAALTHRPPEEVRSVEAVRIMGTTPSGRVDSLHVRANGRDYYVRADSVRWVLRTPNGSGLNSSMLLDATLRSGGDSVALEVHGGGYGHGIGMCQFGAIGRARAGQSYRDILGAYYQGTRITRLY